MTTTEAGDALGLTPNTISDYCRRGILAGEKRGRDWWITDAEVQRYGRERQKPGRPPKVSAAGT